MLRDTTRRQQFTRLAKSQGTNNRNVRRRCGNLSCFTWPASWSAWIPPPVGERNAEQHWAQVHMGSYQVKNHHGIMTRIKHWSRRNQVHGYGVTTRGTPSFRG